MLANRHVYRHSNGVYDIKDYYRLAAKLDRIYPHDKTYQGRSATKVQNFFSILRHTAENGPLSVMEIVKLEYSDDKNRDSLYQTIHRIIHGNKDLKVDGMLQRGLLTPDGKRFGLSVAGVLYCMHVFADESCITKYKDSTQGYDMQIRDSDTILDVLARKYSDVMPYFLGKLEYIKEHQYINTYDIFDVVSPFSTIDHYDAVEYATNSLDKMATAFFYLKLHYTSDRFKVNVRIKDPQILEFVQKLCNNMSTHYDIQRNALECIVKSVTGKMYNMG